MKSLTWRILAVNLIGLLLAGISLLFLDDFRNRLVIERSEQVEVQAQMAATVLGRVPPAEHAPLLVALGRDSRQHLRVHDRNGHVLLDNWRLDRPTFRLVDPESESWRRQTARWLDRLIDRLVAAQRRERYVEPDADDAPGAELRAVINGAPSMSVTRFAPDRTLIFTAALPIDRSRGLYLTASANARDVTRLVRAERLRLGLIVGLSLWLSVALSLYLARTIARPLRHLASAANRVKLGRAREVVVPRLPSRHDEIGMLARAVSDMTLALRARIDAIDAFAADVSHELKNPLASLRSAVETMERINDPAARAQLLAIVDNDVRRLDRMISEISDLSRMDAGLTRTRFETVDLGPMVEALIQERSAFADRDEDGRGAVSPRIAYARPTRGLALVLGDPPPLERAIGNLLDNALSFSPPGGVVRVDTTRIGNRVMVAIEDEGPGVPLPARQAIFERFHTDRPEERRGQHSGLGLAIARTIVEGHGGTIEVDDALASPTGARFVIWLPADTKAARK